MYILSLLYLTFRPNTADTFQLIEEEKVDQAPLGVSLQSEMTVITAENHTKEATTTDLTTEGGRENLEDDREHEQQQLLGPSALLSS